MKNLCIISNSTWNLVNYRYFLIKDLIKYFDISIISPKDKYVEKLITLGCKHIPLDTQSNSLNIFSIIKHIYQANLILKKNNFTYAITYTTKINLLYPIILKLNSIKIILNITGLGSIFSKNHMISFLFKKIYAYNIKISDIKIFQSHSDQKFFFKNLSPIDDQNNFIVPGSGIKINKISKFKYNEDLKFIFVGRLLKKKGIIEFIKIAELIKKQSPRIKFIIAGKIENNSDYVSLNYLNNYIEKGAVEYLGFVENIDSVLSYTDCILFPSTYYEGIPHSLIKAASLGNIIITYNWRGCAETVLENKNGFLIELDENSFSNMLNSIFELIKMNSKKLLDMKQASYQLAKSKFDYQNVNVKVLKSMGINAKN